MAEFGGGFSTGCHQRGCKAVPNAELQKALSAHLMSQEQRADWCSETDFGCELEENEFCSIHGLGSKVVEIRSAKVNAHGRYPGQWFRRHPVGTALLILLLLVLVLALGVALAVLAAAPQVPVTPVTPLLVLGCLHGWVGYNGVCYYFSRDHSIWEQGQERCSELNASLAIAKDEEAMDLLFRLHGNVDFWLGLRRRGQDLHWADGSSYSSRVPVLGNSQCVYLADGKRLRSGNCSSERPYVCSKAQAPL